MMVYYWFEQKGRRIAWDFAAKFWLMVDGVRTGRTDGALVRLTTLIQRESDADAAARLMDVLQELQGPLPLHSGPERRDCQQHRTKNRPQATIYSPTRQSACNIIA